jgi:hypothetical protein
MIPDIVSVIITALLWIVGIGIVILIGFIAYMESQFKHKVIIKTIVHGTTGVRIDKAREITKKDGTTWWKIRKMKREITEPPRQYLDIDEKGKFFIEFIQIDGGDLIPTKSTFEVGEGKDFAIKTQSFAPSQRQIVVSQAVKSERDRKKSIGEILQQAIPIMAVILILVLFMIFFETAVNPMIEVGDKYVAVADKLVIVSTKLDAVIHDRVTLDNYEEVSGEYNTTAPPN